MAGNYVMTENELRKLKPTPESVGMGSYTIDSHNVQRYITPEGNVQNEGDIGVGTNGPYSIAYGSLVPKAGQGSNLLVPVAMSASHIAYGSIRMEPVFMILGQSAATAAVFAIQDGVSVQNVPYAKLREQLLKDGQILEYSGTASARGLDLKSLKGTLMDDKDAAAKGHWQQSSAARKFVGDGYCHDGNEDKGEKTLTFSVKLPEPGRYEVRFGYTANKNRAAYVPVVVRHADGEAKVAIDEREAGPIDDLFVSLGTFEFKTDKPAEVTVSNAGTSGHVVADAVQFLPVK